MTMAREAIGASGAAAAPLARSAGEAARRRSRIRLPRGDRDDAFNRYRRPYRSRLVMAGALSVVQAGLVVLQPWPLKLAIDHAASGAPLPSWTGPIAGLAPSTLAAVTALSSVLLVVVSGLIGYAETMLVGRVAEQDEVERRAVAVDVREMSQHLVGKRCQRLRQRAVERLDARPGVRDLDGLGIPALGGQELLDGGEVVAAVEPRPHGAAAEAATSALPDHLRHLQEHEHRR